MISFVKLFGKKDLLFLRNILIIILLFYLSNALYWEVSGIKIVKINQLSYTKKYIDTINQDYVIQNLSFAVKGYKHNKNNEKELDNFACNIAKLSLNNYKYVNITFYKYSLFTKNKYIKDHIYNRERYLYKYYLWDYSFDKNGVFKIKHDNISNFKFYYPKPQCKK